MGKVPVRVWQVLVCNGNGRGRLQKPKIILVLVRGPLAGIIPVQLTGTRGFVTQGLTLKLSV
jgi:hypothetical protein